MCESQDNKDAKTAVTKGIAMLAFTQINTLQKEENEKTMKLKSKTRNMATERQNTDMTFLEQGSTDSIWNELCTLCVFLCWQLVYSSNFNEYPYKFIMIIAWTLSDK